MHKSTTGGYTAFPNRKSIIEASSRAASGGSRPREDGNGDGGDARERREAGVANPKSLRDLGLERMENLGERAEGARGEVEVEKRGRGSRREIGKLRASWIFQIGRAHV